MTSPSRLPTLNRAARRLALAGGAACLLWLGHPGLAVADLKELRADAYTIEFDQTIGAPPARVYAALGEIDHWWNGEHTWSGDAANLTLGLQAGSCFCERWSRGSVEHGRVIMALSDQILRLDAPLGPLQGRALKAILTFSLKPVGAGTELKMSYVVNGASLSNLSASASGVDEVLGEQLRRFASYVETGRASAAGHP
jgi:hypothetical protein